MTWKRHQLSVNTLIAYLQKWKSAMNNRFHTCFIPVGPTVWSWLRTQQTNPEIGPSLSNVLY